ncbi:hypothetical protein [Erwinia typographi]|uniref:hypothetical protein n=1 Tax=Erwinia typographi TaxID=371042 RepID=UPI0012EE5472|nr:hypothetical protein [Erwinia typographi]
MPMLKVHASFEEEEMVFTPIDTPRASEPIPTDPVPIPEPLPVPQPLPDPPLDPDPILDPPPTYN